MDGPVVGIDFSGAEQAGHGIWLAEVDPQGEGLRVTDCRSAADRFGVADRAPCLGELCAYLGETPHTAGLDFSFGLPAAVHDHDDWGAFRQWFPTAFTDDAAMQDACVERAEAATDGEWTYAPRTTDGPVGASSPYHWLVAKQTFYGIRDVLAPLGGAVTVRPMETGDPPYLCEIYPKATLASLDLPAREYKNDADHAGERRRAIVEGLERETALTFAESVRNTLVSDAGGHALDSVVAALAADRARRADFEPDREYDPVEGHIYV